jgi:D-alanyl-D-alanine carboxypeptidase
MRKLAATLALILGASVIPLSSSSAADTSEIASAFNALVKNRNLANPAVIVVDEKTGEVVFEKNSYQTRKPASVIKLLSATAAYTYMNPNDSYTTSLWEGVDSQSVVIQGSFDPWICDDAELAKKMERTSLPLIRWQIAQTLSRITANEGDGMTVYYSNFYPQDVELIKKYLRNRKINARLQLLSPAAAIKKSSVQVLSSTSPTLQIILDWTLTWSDNLLAERIARSASVAAGNTRDTVGVSTTFHTLFESLGIKHNGLVVKDGSGLSRENRVTARQISDLLLALSRDEKFLPLLAGLPIGGVTGTLSERFIETAPNAIGLVRAKTGTLYGTTNLAGFVESESSEYIFVILADRHSRSYTITKKVRAFVDRILGLIAKPLQLELFSDKFIN